MMSIKRKKETFSQNNTALYEHALDLYLNNNQPDKALQIFLKLAKDRYKRAFGEIGIIMYREKHDVKKAEKWFKSAEQIGVLLGAAAYEYGMLLYLGKNDWKKGLSYLLKAAEQGFELAYGEIGIILYLYKLDSKQAERWFEKAENADALLAPSAYYYGLLLMLEKNELEKCGKYFKQSALEGFELAYAEYASILYLDKMDVDKAIVYFKKAEKADCLPAPHAYTYGELLINERNEIEKGKRYIDMAETDGYYEE